MAYPRFQASPHFITSVPFTESFRAGEQRSEQRRAADLSARISENQLSESQRLSQEKQNLDAAYRRAMQPPQAPQTIAPPAPEAAGAPGEMPGTEAAPGGGMRQIGGGAMTQLPTGAPVEPTAPAAAPATPTAAPRNTYTDRARQELANTPGGGHAAFALAQQQEKQRDDAETRMMERLAEGDVQGGMYWANKAGINPPAELVQRADFWQGAKMAKQFYGEDMERGHKFAQVFMTTQGDPIAKMQAGLQAAGAPVNRTSWATVTMADGIYQVNPITGMRRKIGDAYRTPQYMTGQDGSVVQVMPGQTEVQPLMGPNGQPFKGNKFGRVGGGGGTIDFIAQKLMAEDPELTYQEAIGLARRSPNGDQATMQRERLALLGAKNDRNFRRDPDGTLAQWRQRYGLAPDAAPAAAPAPATAGGAGPTAQPNVAPAANPATVGMQPVAVPPELAAEPDGTIVRDDETGQEYEKRGGQLIPR